MKFRKFGAGMRGGSFTLTRADAKLDLTYERVRFARDVAVSGRAHVDFDTGAVAADLDVDGPGREDGTLRVAGPLFPHTGPVPARGVIDGRRVAVLVPSA